MVRTYWRRGRFGVLLVITLAVILAGCGSSSQAPTTVATTPTHPASAAPSVSASAPDDASGSPACALLPTQTFEQVFSETPTRIAPVAAGSKGSWCTYYVATANGPQNGQVLVKVICGKGAEGDMFAVEGAVNTLPQVGPDAYDSLDSQMQPAGSDFISDTEEIYVDNDSAGNTAGEPAAGSRSRMITALSIAVHNESLIKPCGAQPSASVSAG